MLEAMRNDANDIARSARVRTSVELDADAEQTDGRAGGFADPEGAAIAAEYKDLLYEFLAELPDTDRLIAYLHLDPRWAPRQIAKRLGIPLADVERTTDRVGRRMSRFTALLANPDALCERRRDDVLAFLQTGRASLELRRHLIRCPSCSVELRRSREQLRATLLPLLPAGAIPAASLDVLARAHRALAAHPATLRVNDAAMRVRKLVPGGAVGGGSAALTVKVLAAGTVLSVGAAIHVVGGLEHTPHHAQHHHLARVAAISTTSTTTTPMAVVPASTPTLQPLPAPVIATKTTATTASTTTTSTTSVVIQAPNATIARVDSARPAASSAAGGAAPAPTLNPYPVAAAAPNATASSQHSSNSGSSSSPLPTANLAP